LKIRERFPFEFTEYLQINHFIMTKKRYNK